VKVLCQTIDRAIEAATKELVAQYHQPFVPAADFSAGGDDVCIELTLAGTAVGFESVDSVDSRDDETESALSELDWSS
jgi:hypothetical protein